MPVEIIKQRLEAEKAKRQREQEELAALRSKAEYVSAAPNYAEREEERKLASERILTESGALQGLTRIYEELVNGNYPKYYLGWKNSTSMILIWGKHFRLQQGEFELKIDYDRPRLFSPYFGPKDYSLLEVRTDIDSQTISFSGQGSNPKVNLKREVWFGNRELVDMTLAEAYLNPLREYYDPNATVDLSWYTYRDGGP
ncbi:MAG: hypothetical protein A2W07_08170 [candidate division Zixibacteria bacterium RBG_16_43_9]|nr:MAG: hypothetical protein A2W07_08170 [candidate division Zixibacteria bacterium RBG_16_43_9]